MPPDAVVLAFDTSAAHCAAALLCSGRVMCSHAEPMAKGQAERLLPMIEEMMATQGVALADLTGIAVGTGPGNFTGIRIAVSLARGLALGLGVPAVGVTGFQAVSHTAGMAAGIEGPHWVAIDAPRGQVYAQRFVPLGAPVIRDATFVFDAPVLRMADLTPDQLVRGIADVGAGLLAAPQPRPAPFYLRGADAAPPSDPPPVILP